MEVPAKGITGSAFRGIVCSYMARFLKGWKGPAVYDALQRGDEISWAEIDLLEGAFDLRQIDDLCDKDGVDVAVGEALARFEDKTLVSVDWTTEGCTDVLDEFAELEEDDEPCNNSEGDEGTLTLEKCLQLFTEPEVIIVPHFVVLNKRGC